MTREERLAVWCLWGGLVALGALVWILSRNVGKIWAFLDHLLNGCPECLAERKAGAEAARRVIKDAGGEA